MFPDVSSSSLADLLDAALRTAVNPTEALAQIDQLLHRAAVELLNIALPTVVRGGSLPAKAASLAVVSASSARVALTLDGAGFSNTVLQGEVAKKVAEGIETLKAGNDYAKAVNSIAW